MRKEPQATYYKNGISVKYPNRRLTVMKDGDVLHVQFKTQLKEDDGKFCHSIQVRKNLQVAELRITKLTARMLLGILLEMNHDGKLSGPISRSQENGENK